MKKVFRICFRHKSNRYGKVVISAIAQGETWQDAKCTLDYAPLEQKVGHKLTWHSIYDQEDKLVTTLNRERYG